MISKFNPCPQIGNDEAREVLGALLRVGGKPISFTALLRFRGQGMPHTKFGKICSCDAGQIVASAERFKRGLYLASNSTLSGWSSGKNQGVNDSVLVAGDAKGPK